GDKIMADDNHPHDLYRREPTVEGPDDSPTATAEPRDETHHGNNRHEGLVHERRDERHHVRVDIPFQVQFGRGEPLPGDDLSMGGFSIHGTRPIEPGKVLAASLLI